MKLPNDYDETVGVNGGDFETIEAGGYICKIVSAKIEKSQTQKDMLVIAYDIAEGEHKDFYQRRYDSYKENSTPDNPAKWPTNGVHRTMILDSNGKCNKFFKGLITAIEESNEGFKFNDGKGNADESKLKGKLFGALIGREQYVGNDGNLKFSSKIRFIRSVQTIEDGKFDIPEDKLVDSGIPGATFTNSDDDDLPF